MRVGLPEPKIEGRATSRFTRETITNRLAKIRGMPEHAAEQAYLEKKLVEMDRKEATRP